MAGVGTKQTERREQLGYRLVNAELPVIQEHTHTYTLYHASMVLFILFPLPGLVGSILFLSFVFFGLVPTNFHSLFRS